MNDRLAESAPLLKSVGRHMQQNPLQRLDELNRFEGFARELKVEVFVSQEGSNRVMEGFDLDIFHMFLKQTSWREKAEIDVNTLSLLNG